MSEKEYFKGQCVKTIVGYAYIEECHEDGTYTLRKVDDDRFLGRLTAEGIEKEWQFEDEEEEEEEDEDD